MIKVLKLHVLFFLTILASKLYGQSWSPQVGDSLFVYTYLQDGPLKNLGQMDFYDFDFYCMDILTLTASDIPRVDFELQDQFGFGEVYALQDDKILLKGFRMKDPYFGESTKFIQLIGGIPMVQFDNIKKHKHDGVQNFYLEYGVQDLPESIALWAELHGYDKMRLKVSIVFSTQYTGRENISIGHPVRCNKIRTNYTVDISEVLMKKEDWVKVRKADVPQSEQFFQKTFYDYTTYFKKDDSYGLVRKYTHPEIKLEYRLKTPVQIIPHCTTDEMQVYVYPNPTLGDLNVRMGDLQSGRYYFALYNIIGYKVWETELNLKDKEHFRLRLPHMDKGIYLYSIKDSNDRYIQSKRLTVLEH